MDLDKTMRRPKSGNKTEPISVITTRTIYETQFGLLLLYQNLETMSRYNLCIVGLHIHDKGTKPALPLLGVNKNYQLSLNEVNHP